MGADFCCAVAILPTEEEVSEIHQRINQLSESSVEEWLLDVHGDLESYREHLRRCVTELADADNRRDAASIRLGDRWLILTGGMTWGDNPTDLCQPIWDLEEAKVLVPSWDDYEFKRKQVDPAAIEEARSYLHTIPESLYDDESLLPTRGNGSDSDRGIGRSGR